MTRVVEIVARVVGAMLLGATLGVSLAACGSVLVSKAVVGEAPGVADCKDGKLSYYLPKRLLTVKVTAGALEVTQASDTDGASTIVGDTRYGPFCLAFRGSWFADDKLQVDVDPKNGVLKKVVFNAKDKTASIANDLIQAFGKLAVLIAADREDNGEPALKDAGPFLVDPFDQRTMTEMNRTLRDTGYCVFLDARNDPFVPAWSNGMCAATGYPQVPDATAGLQTFDSSVDLSRYNGAGILYRPLINHTIVAMRRAQKKWELAQTKQVQLPNAAPAFMMQVNRAWIGDSQAQIIFDGGTPVNVQVAKQGELSVFVDIPLTIVQVAVSLPMSVLTYRKDALNNQLALLKVNAQLIDTLEKAEAARDADLSRALGGTAGANTALSGTNFSECLNNTLVATDPNPVLSCADAINQGL